MLKDAPTSRSARQFKTPTLKIPAIPVAMKFKYVFTIRPFVCSRCLKAYPRPMVPTAAATMGITTISEWSVQDSALARGEDSVAYCNGGPEAHCVLHDQ